MKINYINSYCYSSSDLPAAIYIGDHHLILYLQNPNISIFFYCFFFFNHFGHPFSISPNPKCWESQNQNHQPHLWLYSTPVILRYCGTNLRCSVFLFTFSLLVFFFFFPLWIISVGLSWSILILSSVVSGVWINPKTYFIYVTIFISSISIWLLQFLFLCWNLPLVHTCSPLFLLEPLIYYCYFKFTIWYFQQLSHPESTDHCYFWQWVVYFFAFLYVLHV